MACGVRPARTLCGRKAAPMRASRPDNHHSHCSRCFLRREICICPILPTVPTRAEFIILRHITETRRPSNTGRLAALALPNSRIVSCGGGDRIGLSTFDEEWLRAPAHGRTGRICRRRSALWFWTRHGGRRGGCIPALRHCGPCPDWFCPHPHACGTGCGSNIARMECQHSRR